MGLLDFLHKHDWQEYRMMYGFLRYCQSCKRWEFNSENGDGWTEIEAYRGKSWEDVWHKPVGWF